MYDNNIKMPYLKEMKGVKLNIASNTQPLPKPGKYQGATDVARLPSPYIIDNPVPPTNTPFAGNQIGSYF
jgi:hypothetical protein